jgi:16S rRNA (guanine527-N7)-methyltransferase
MSSPARARRARPAAVGADLHGPLPAGGGAAEERLRALAGRYGLDVVQAARLRALLALLASDDRAPTTVRDPARAVDVHVADSLSALELDAVRSAHTACDIGAGAGFPGLPLAIALPRCQVWLIESASRKYRFLRRVIAALQLVNAEAVGGRVEEWSAGAGRHDVALARALAPAAVVVEYAAPLLRLGGVLVDWRGGRDLEDERRGAAAAAMVGLEQAEIRHVTNQIGADRHHLHLYVKVRDTPHRFPRRPGMARKRPLEGSGSR